MPNKLSKNDEIKKILKKNLKNLKIKVKRAWLCIIHYCNKKSSPFNIYTCHIP
jgi:hypothetical protein